MNYTLSGSDLKSMRMPMVYVWQRNGRYLYIGRSLVGIKRLCNHNIITSDNLKPRDTIRVILCGTKRIAILVEIALIERFSPERNKQQPRRTRNECAWRDCREQRYVAFSYCRTHYREYQRNYHRLIYQPKLRAAKQAVQGSLK